MAINQSGELADTKEKEEPIDSGEPSSEFGGEMGINRACGSSVLNTGGYRTRGPLAVGLLALAGPEENEARPHEQWVAHQACRSARC